MPTQWPEAKYKCAQCREQKQQQHFNIANTVCYVCQAKDKADKLVQDMAERHAKRKQAKKTLRDRGKALAKGTVAMHKARAKEKAKAQKTIDARVATVEKQLSVEQQAERELASRELARRSLLHFTERNLPSYEAGWVHEDIAFRLERFVEQVELKMSPRLMLWVPPRHGKSELASVQFPPWVLGKHAEWEFITASYAIDLPLRFSRRIRQMIRSDAYHAVFPDTHISTDSAAAEAWLTTMNGGYRAAGVKVGITGMGAHILSIDDPVKDASEADSEVNRNGVWDWFGSTAYTRLAPGGGILVIQTRWHDDDLSGRLQSAMDEAVKELDVLKDDLRSAKLKAKTPQQKRDVAAIEENLELHEATIDHWEIVEYPAIATSDEYFVLRTGNIERGDEPEEPHKKLRSKGEALHPQRFPVYLLGKYKRQLPPRHWSALYQQSPTPDEGAFFTKNMLNVGAAPDHRELYTYAAWDLAIGQKNSSDYTVGVVGGLDWDGRLWVLDMIRGRFDMLQICEHILDMASRWNVLLTGVEKGPLEAALMPELRRMMQEPDTPNIAIADGNESLRPVTDKRVRARPLQGIMQQGKVTFSDTMQGLDTAFNELLRFDTGKFDDIVDGMAWLARMVSGKGRPPNPLDVLLRMKGQKSWKTRMKERGRGTIGARKNFMAR